MKKLSSFFQPMLLIGIFFGIFITIFVTRIVHGQSSVISACVKSNGSIRIITGNTCSAGETLLSWNTEGPPGPAGSPGPSGPPGASGYFGLPFICTAGCELNRFADKFAGKDFSNAQIYSSYFADANLQGVIFKGGNLNGSDFNHSDLTNADLSDLVDFNGGADGGSVLNFYGANLTNTNISNVLLRGSNFTNTILQNTNFTNSNFENVNFTGATMMSTANLTSVVWNNTTCPDGSNSDASGSTCVGHF